MMGSVLRKAGMALISLSVLGGMALMAPSPAEARAHLGVGVIIPLGPPAPREEPVPPPPLQYRADRVAWQPGHWRWDGHDYEWEPGHYVELPRHRHHWEAGRWEQRPGGWVWLDGRWR